MKRNATILVGDRNPHVRQFMHREMVHAGFEVLLAENGYQLFSWIRRHSGLDVVVLDPDLPDMETDILLDRLCTQFPDLLILLHIHPNEEAPVVKGANVWCIEKQANSIEKIIQVAEKILAFKRLPQE